MKNFIFLLFLLPCLSVQAQTKKLGFRGGVSFSNLLSHNSSGSQPSVFPPQNLGTTGGIQLINGPMSYPYYETDFLTDMRTGFYSEFFYNSELGKKWKVEIGLGYSQRGINLNYRLNANAANANNTITKLNFQFNRDFRIDYLTVPTTFQYYLDRKERFYVLMGVYNSIALNFVILNSTSIENRQVVNTAGERLIEFRSTSTVRTAYASLFDSGLIGGIGIVWPLKDQWSVGIDFRSSVGLVSVPKKYKEVRFLSFSRKTKNINFETGLRILYSLNP